MPDHPVPPALTPETPVTEQSIDFRRLEAAQARWHYEHQINPDDVPWLIEIARSVRYLRVTPEDVQLLQSVAAHWDRYCDGDEAKEISALASRISSLLPPPPTNTGAITLRVSETRADDIKVCAVCGGADSHRPGCRFASSSPPPTT